MIKNIFYNKGSNATLMEINNHYENVTIFKKKLSDLKNFEAERIKRRSDKTDLISRIFANFPY